MENLCYQPKRLAKRSMPVKYQPHYYSGEVSRVNWDAFFKRLRYLGKKKFRVLLSHVVRALDKLNTAVIRFIDRIGVNKVIDIYFAISITLIVVIGVICIASANESANAIKDTAQFPQETIDAVVETPDINFRYSSIKNELIDPPISPIIEKAIGTFDEVIIDEPIAEEPVEEQPVVEEVDTEPVLDITDEHDSVTPLAEQLNAEGVVLSYLGVYHITGYDPLCEHCCGKSDGITASGEPAEYYKTVAMNGIPFGTKIYIPNYGVFTVEDRGGNSVGVDIACPGHDACYLVTNAGMDVYIVEEAQ